MTYADYLQALQDFDDQDQRDAILDQAAEDDELGCDQFVDLLIRFGNAAG